MKNNANLNSWSNYCFELNSNLVSNKQIKLALESFKNDIFLSLNGKSSLNPINSTTNCKIETLRLLIMFKVKNLNNQYKSISYMQTIDLKDIDKLTNIFIEYWGFKPEDYRLAEITDIVFTYKIVNCSIDEIIKPKLIRPSDRAEKFNIIDSKKWIRFGGYSLPSTMDSTDWGDYHLIDENHIIVYKKGSHLEYHVKLFDRYQLVDLKLNETILLSFKDVMNHKEDLSSFTRHLKNQEYVFIEGELVIKKIKKGVKFLSKLKRNMYNSKNFITMDLETRIINEEMTSYCVVIYDGKLSKSFYLADYLDLSLSPEKDMLRDSIKYLMRRKYNNFKIYLHNFSKFDAVYLLTILTDLSDEVQPILRDGRFINLSLKFAGKYNLHFRDSFLILPDSLRNLALNFNVKSKGIFPYRFLNNKEISLSYIGPVPLISYFENITKEEYEEYTSDIELNNNNNWDLRKETIKYCELDCIVLYQILNEFSNNIYNLFRIDILQYPTLSSLAFAIYRIKFLKDSQIPLIHGEIYNFIKKSYTGGSVDVYKPTLSLTSEKSKIYRYDVNSLYPKAMKDFPMPCGNPIYFEGDILNAKFKTLNEDKPFGIFEVEIETPLNIKIPLLQVRTPTENGYRTIAPIGNWTGHYFSDELYNESKYGYKFKVKRGYLFEKGDIFSEYVDYFYNLKKQSSKGSPNYIISKLLLNSLYGRLGMNPETEQHRIITNAEGLELYSKFDITNILDLKNGKELVSFFNLPSELNDNSNYDIKNVSVVVSSIVTASARIYMSRFKTDNSINIYYSDTDSIDIDQKLDVNLIGEEIGQMKLEHIFKDAVFLAPKMYGGLTDDYEYVKIKGLKNPIQFKELKPLLFKGSKLEVTQEKWYSDISNGKFNIKDEIYTLMVTDNKRKLLYNSENIFYDTVPLRLEKGKILKQETKI